VIDLFVTDGSLPRAATSAAAYLLSCASGAFASPGSVGFPVLHTYRKEFGRPTMTSLPVLFVRHGATPRRSLPPVGILRASAFCLRSAGRADLADTEPLAGRDHPVLYCPFRAFSPFTHYGRACSEPAPPFGWGGTLTGVRSESERNATWLILPVVICLSQRLSHACVSMN
jgi:hypothetical protein